MAIQIYELCGADETNLFSPHCWKTRMSVAHKGLDHESIATPFTSVATVEGGDSRRVPVIRDGDTVVEESFKIAEYLDEKYPDSPKLLHSGVDKAMTNFIINWSQTQLHPLVARMAIMEIHDALAPADQEFFRTTREKLFGMSLEDFATKMAATPDDLKKALVPLELTLKGQKFIGGDTPHFADYVVFGALQWLRICKGEAVLPQEGTVANWFNSLLDMYDGMGRAAKAA
jgi:glutathione S-transferase